MINGECRVDTLPFGSAANAPADRRLALDGLRLQLDLRIVPSGGEGAAAAIWRIENASVAAQPLGIPAAYRRLAVAAGLAVLGLALALWFAAPPSAPVEPPGLAKTSAPVEPPGLPKTSAPVEPPGLPKTSATAAVAASDDARAPAARPAPAPSVAPRISVVPAERAAAAAPKPAAVAPNPAVLDTRPSEPARRAPAPPAPAAAPVRGASDAESAKASPARELVDEGVHEPARDDLLDLFGDPK